MPFVNWESYIAGANAEAAVLAELIREYDGLAIRSGTKVPESVLENPRKSKVIGKAGVGVDNIDTKAVTRHGIVVMNAPGGNTVTTAEHAISLILRMVLSWNSARFARRVFSSLVKNSTKVYQAFSV